MHIDAASIRPNTLLVLCTYAYAGAPNIYTSRHHLRHKHLDTLHFLSTVGMLGTETWQLLLEDKHAIAAATGAQLSLHSKGQNSVR